VEWHTDHDVWLYEIGVRGARSRVPARSGTPIVDAWPYEPVAVRDERGAAGAAGGSGADQDPCGLGAGDHGAVVARL